MAGWRQLEVLRVRYRENASLELRLEGRQTFLVFLIGSSGHLGEHRF